MFDKRGLVIYRGRSMTPTLMPFDILEVVPYKGRRIKRGDVVVFIPPGRRQMVVHRVFSIDSSGIRTKGDSNPDADSIILKPDDVIGRVVSVQRSNKRIRIYRGRIGEKMLIIKRMTIRFDNVISRLLHYPYHYLAKTGLFRLFLPSTLRPRVITFKRPLHDELQIVMGRRVIGRFIAQEGRWQIKRPFLLFIDGQTINE
ncbi:MAG: hypothetical protein Fur0020_10150 [Thermodesulfovibrionia bacterium]